MKDLAQLNEIALAPIDSAEQLLALRDSIAAAKAFLKDVDKVVEDRTIEWINEHGPLLCGDMRYIVGETITYRPRLTPESMHEALMVLHDGDMGKVVGYLAANAFKHGAIRRDKPEAFDKLFETVVKRTVEGKIVKGVKVINTKFVKSMAHECADSE